MNSTDYRKEILEIEEKIKAKRTDEIKRLDERLSVEKQDVIEALNSLWIFKNDVPPPNIEDLFQIDEDEGQNKADSNKKDDSDFEDFFAQLDQMPTRNDKLRGIVKNYAGGIEVTAQKVFDTYKEIYPDSAQDLESKKTLISKLLRQLESDGELKKIQTGSGATQTIYLKL